MSRFMREKYREMSAYVPGEQPKIDGLIKLNTNESPFPPSPKVQEAVIGAANRLNLYSDPTLEKLNRAIADRYRVMPSQVICGNGSDELLAFAFLAFGGDGAIFPDITYGFYKVWCGLFGVDYHTPNLNKDFTINPNDYKANTSMVVIANPNAPTGVLLPIEDIRDILMANPDHVVLIDEAYIDFGGTSALSLIDEFENLLVVRTCSKSRSLAGARLGYAMGSTKLIEDLNKIKFSFHPYNVNSMTAAAGIAAMEDEDYFINCCNSIIENREYTKSFLLKMGFELTDSSANFVFAKYPRISGSKLANMLRMEKILVRHFEQPGISDYLRITVGSREQMKYLEMTISKLLREK